MKKRVMEMTTKWEKNIGFGVSIALQNYQCPFDSETLSRSIDLILDPFIYVYREKGVI